MSTRGLYGFYKNGITKTTYNHNDSLPEELGNNIVNFLRDTTIPELNAIFDKIILVDGNEKPSVSQYFEHYKYDTRKNWQPMDDWDAVLREYQGNLQVYKDGLQYMTDDLSFIHNSLFCEYVYIINLDTNVMEVYYGGQRKPTKDRYYNESYPYIDNTLSLDYVYYNCKMVIEFPLDNIPENWIELLPKNDEV